MANRFVSYSPREFQQTYEPLPMDNMIQLGQIGQRRNDQIYATLGAAQANMFVEGGPGTEAKVKQVNDRRQAEFDAVFNDWSTTKNSQKAIQDAFRLKSQWASDKDAAWLQKTKALEPGLFAKVGDEGYGTSSMYKTHDPETGMWDLGGIEGIDKMIANDRTVDPSLYGYMSSKSKSEAYDNMLKNIVPEKFSYDFIEDNKDPNGGYYQDKASGEKLSLDHMWNKISAEVNNLGPNLEGIESWGAEAAQRVSWEKERARRKGETWDKDNFTNDLASYMNVRTYDHTKQAGKPVGSGSGSNGKTDRPTGFFDEPIFSESTYQNVTEGASEKGLNFLAEGIAGIDPLTERNRTFETPDDYKKMWEEIDYPESGEYTPEFESQNLKNEMEKQYQLIKNSPASYSYKAGSTTEKVPKYSESKMKTMAYEKAKDISDLEYRVRVFSTQVYNDDKEKYKNLELTKAGEPILNKASKEAIKTRIAIRNINLVQQLTDELGMNVVVTKDNLMSITDKISDEKGKSIRITPGGGANKETRTEISYGDYIDQMMNREIKAANAAYDNRDEFYKALDERIKNRYQNMGKTRIQMQLRTGDGISEKNTNPKHQAFAQAATIAAKNIDKLYQAGIPVADEDNLKDNVFAHSYVDRNGDEQDWNDADFIASFGEWDNDGNRYFAKGFLTKKEGGKTIESKKMFEVDMTDQMMNGIGIIGLDEQQSLLMSDRLQDIADKMLEGEVRNILIDPESKIEKATGDNPLSIVRNYDSNTFSLKGNYIGVDENGNPTIKDATTYLEEVYGTTELSSAMVKQVGNEMLMGMTDYMRTNRSTDYSADTIADMKVKGIDPSKVKSIGYGLFQITDKYHQKEVQDRITKNNPQWSYIDPKNMTPSQNIEYAGLLANEGWSFMKNGKQQNVWNAADKTTDSDGKTVYKNQNTQKAMTSIKEAFKNNNFHDSDAIALTGLPKSKIDEIKQAFKNAPANDEGLPNWMYALAIMMGESGGNINAKGYDL